MRRSCHCYRPDRMRIEHPQLLNRFKF
ncbi:hypothetical protein OYC58_000930 [Cutibacterium acnes]|nr:hypothetical protein OYC58_000930 [Cutibacterium acnes]